MKKICAWCEHEGRPTVVPEADGGDDRPVNYGICDSHSARLVAQLHKYYPPRRRKADFPQTLSA
jgi:hypothetical protein